MLTICSCNGTFCQLDTWKSSPPAIVPTRCLCDDAERLGILSTKRHILLARRCLKVFTFHFQYAVAKMDVVLNDAGISRNVRRAKVFVLAVAFWIADVMVNGA